MENHEYRSIRRTGEGLTYDMLVLIFSTFHVLDLVLCCSQVSRSWRLACSDPSLWNSLDLTALGNYFSIPKIPFAWSDEHHSNMLQRILTRAFSLSRGNIVNLYFHFYASISDSHLLLAVESCPRLRRLVLSPSGRLTVRSFRSAMMMWQSTLESILVPFIGSSNLKVLRFMGEMCLVLKELKFACRLNMEMATYLATYLPNLRALSLRGSIIDRDAFEFILENMINLEALNITHAMVIYDPETSTDDILIYPDLTDAIVEKASRLSEFYTCNKFTCEECVRRFSSLASIRALVDGYWYNARGEGFWKVDEIQSLAY